MHAQDAAICHWSAAARLCTAAGQNAEARRENARRQDSDRASEAGRRLPLRRVARLYVAAGSYGLAFGDDAIWATSTDKSVVTRVDPHTNLIVETIPVGKSPRFVAAGAGSVWTLNQGDGSVSRIDTKTNKVTATIEIGVPGGGGDIAVGEGSVWVTAFEYPLSRIDPSTNTVVQQFYGKGGDAVRVGLGSIWLSNLEAGNVWRIDPKRVEATLPE